MRHSELNEQLRETAMPIGSSQVGAEQSSVPLLQLSELSKRYRAEDEPAVADLTLALQAGEILALLGPSGCGKTTTLRMIAGFEVPDTGDVQLRGKSILALPTRDRGIGVVFQDYALFPHLNLLRNVMFAMRHVPRGERAQRAVKWLELVGLKKYTQRMPDELSGGQQQRAALARTLAAEPKLILLDEPFSNLDAALRESTRLEVRQILKEAGTTAILVTHDQAEALSFADKVGVMSEGRLQQLDTPEAVYHRPRTAFVAEFLGHTNLLDCTANGRTATCALGAIDLATSGDGPVQVSMRPEHLSLAPADGQNDANCVIESREFRGHDNFYRVRSLNPADSMEYKVLAPFNVVLATGAQARLLPCQPGVILEAE